MTERRHEPRWMWKVVAVSIASGVVGFMLPLLLTESPDQRRAALVTTKTVLLQRDHSIRQKFDALKTGIGAFEATVADIWKVTALRKLREDHMLQESHEHLDTIKKSMVERRAAMESLLVDTTRSIRDAIRTLHDRSVCLSPKHPIQHATTGEAVEPSSSVDTMEDTTNVATPSTSTTSKASDVAASGHNALTTPPIAPSASLDPRQPSTPSSPPVRPPKSRPPPEQTPPPSPPRHFPITFLQAAMAFFTALVTLVAFSLINEYHRRGSDQDFSVEGFFSPLRKQRPRQDTVQFPQVPKRTGSASAAVDEFLAESGSYYDVQYPHEGSNLTEATPVRRSRRLDTAARAPPAYF